MPNKAMEHYAAKRREVHRWRSSRRRKDRDTGVVDLSGQYTESDNIPVPASRRRAEARRYGARAKAGCDYERYADGMKSVVTETRYPSPSPLPPGEGQGEGSVSTFSWEYNNIGRLVRETLDAEGRHRRNAACLHSAVLLP